MNNHLLKGALSMNDMANTYNGYGGATLDYKGVAPSNQTVFTYCKVIHDGEEVIFRHGKKSIGGARGDELDINRADLIVDLSGTFASRIERAKRDRDAAARFVLSGPERFQKLAKYIKPDFENLDNLPEILRLDWRDMSVPPVGLNFWREMWKLIPDGHTIFCCMGSHGRTGTALASMVLASNPKVSSGESMQMIWDRHCEDAIETDSQMEYLRRLAAARPNGDGADRAEHKKARKGKGV